MLILPTYQTNPMMTALPTPCPSSSGSGSALIGQVAVIGRSVVTPRHGSGHRPGYRACCVRGRNPTTVHSNW